MFIGPSEERIGFLSIQGKLLRNKTLQNSNPINRIQSSSTDEAYTKSIKDMLSSVKNKTHLTRDYIIFDVTTMFAGALLDHFSTSNYLSHMEQRSR